jgi:hypothetical protein
LPSETWPGPRQCPARRSGLAWLPPRSDMASGRLLGNVGKVTFEGKAAKTRGKRVTLLTFPTFRDIDFLSRIGLSQRRRSRCARFSRWPTRAFVAALKIGVSFLLYSLLATCLLSTFWVSHMASLASYGQVTFSKVRIVSPLWDQHLRCRKSHMANMANMAKPCASCAESSVLSGRCVKLGTVTPPVAATLSLFS